MSFPIVSKCSCLLTNLNHFRVRMGGSEIPIIPIIQYKFHLKMYYWLIIEPKLIEQNTTACSQKFTIGADYIMLYEKGK